MQIYHWSLGDLEDMMPWERAVYIDQLHSHLKLEEQHARDSMMERLQKTGQAARNFVRPAENKRRNG